MLSRWWTQYRFASKVRRAVRHFNTLLPQQRIVVFIHLLRDHPDLAIQFRRALKLEAPKQDRRIELATGPFDARPRRR